jgi:hypothetical protein
VAKRRRDGVVAVGKNVRFDDDAVPRDTFGGKAALVHLGAHALDDDARRWVV